jgi:hypothetical protein
MVNPFRIIAVNQKRASGMAFCQGEWYNRHDAVLVFARDTLTVELRGIRRKTAHGD